MIRSSLPSLGLLVVIGCSSDPSSDDGPGGATGTAGVPGQAGVSGAAPNGGAPAGGAPSAAGRSGSAGAGGTAAGAGGAARGGAGGSAGSNVGGVSGAGAGNAGRGGSAGSGAVAGSGGSVAGGGTPSGGSGGGGTDAVQFYAATCAPCHGAKGEGISGKAPEIQHPVRDFATWVVRNGRQGNPGFPQSAMAAYNQSTLPDATLKGIFDWLSEPTLPKPTTGAALYADYCATCHGANGAGGTAGHAAKGEPLSKAISMVRSGHNLTQFSARTGYMPQWTASELSDADVGLIVDYLKTL